MSNRDAVDTIRGYFYQFNKSIFEILRQTDENTQITIEGIEDIDLKNGNNETFIQCKYYSGQEYNHSVIKNAIELFFEHFMKNKSNNIIYNLYANFKSGQHKLPSELEIEFVKKNFLTRKVDGVVHYIYIEKEADDLDIEKFIAHLKINISTPSYEQLESDIMNILKKTTNLDIKLSEFYLLKSQSIIKQLATSKNFDDRKITKKDFINKLLDINGKLDEWVIDKTSYSKYYSILRKKYFTVQNISPFDRFFIIDCSTFKNINSLRIIVQEISKKWSKNSPRNTQSFCPYIVFYNIEEKDLLELKIELFNEGFNFIDGYCFKNSPFSVEALFEDVTYYNKIKVKFVEMDNLDIVLEYSKKTKCIYQFYLNNITFVNNKYDIVNVKLEKIEDILLVI